MNLALLLNRVPLSLFQRTQETRPQQPPPTGHTYGGDTYHGLSQQLTAARIRTAFFPTVRRGYHPEAVRHLLAQAADEITRLQQCLANVYAENDRIKTALKQWQSDHAATCRRTEPDTRTHWPVNPSPAPGSGRGWGVTGTSVPVICSASSGTAGRGDRG